MTSTAQSRFFRDFDFIVPANTRLIIKIKVRVLYRRRSRSIFLVEAVATC